MRTGAQAVGVGVIGRGLNAPARGGERGFALLLVFLMAAVIGITLWAELPRVALQSQRAKEQMLVERGEQYKRAIQLFLRANKGTRYPADMDDLDRGFNNLRFLRHRYKDPMTGKDEWRIIHIQGGVLTDSLLSKPKDNGKPEATTLGQNISALPGLGELAGQGQALPNAVNRRRASEGGTGGGIGPDGQPIQPAEPANGMQPSAGPTAGIFQPGVAPEGTPQPGAGPAPGIFQPGVVPGGMPQPSLGIPGMPGGPGMPFGAAPGSGGIPGMPGMGQFPGQSPGVPGQLGLPGSNAGANAGANGQTGGATGDGGSTVGSYGPTVGGGTLTGAQPNAPGVAGGSNPANGPNAANGMGPGAALAPGGAAASMLNGLLTTPNPRGFPGNGQAGTVIGGGMAGVASKMDSEGLMVYNDRTNYKEWEFVYDKSKDRPLQDPRAMMVGNQMGTPSSTTQSPTTPPGQPGMFNQPGQSGSAGQVGPSAPMGPGGQMGSSGQTGSNGQPGSQAGGGGYGQGGPPDIRPGKK